MMPRYSDPLLSSRSKQIEFSVMAPSEMVQASEVQIFERTLYKVVNARLWLTQEHGPFTTSFLLTDSLEPARWQQLKS